MLKHWIGVGCIFICTITIDPTSSRTTKSSGHARNSQHEGNATRGKDLLETGLLTTEFPSFNNRTSLNMLGDITAKVWGILPVVEIPRSWVLGYCTRYTEIYEDIEKAAMKCQYDGPDWECVFIELVKSRKKRFLRRKNQSLRNLKNIRKSSKKQEEKHDEELKKTRRAAKEVKDIRRSLMNKIRELENKKSLSSKEETELGQLHLTMASKLHGNLEEYPITEDRTELSRLQEIGSCLSRQAAKACESVILNAVQKLI